MTSRIQLLHTRSLPGRNNPHAYNIHCITADLSMNATLPYLCVSITSPPSDRHQVQAPPPAVTRQTAPFKDKYHKQQYVSHLNISTLLIEICLEYWSPQHTVLIFMKLSMSNWCNGQVMYTVLIISEPNWDTTNMPTTVNEKYKYNLCKGHWGTVELECKWSRHCQTVNESAKFIYR